VLRECEKFWSASTQTRTGGRVPQLVKAGGIKHDVIVDGSTGLPLHLGRELSGEVVSVEWGAVRGNRCHKSETLMHRREVARTTEGYMHTLRQEIRWKQRDT
jgi:hypothetical protein